MASRRDALGRLVCYTAKATRHGPRHRRRALTNNGGEKSLENTARSFKHTWLLLLVLILISSNNTRTQCNSHVPSPGRRPRGQLRRALTDSGERQPSPHAGVGTLCPRVSVRAPRRLIRPPGTVPQLLLTSPYAAAVHSTPRSWLRVWGAGAIFSVLHL